MRNGTREATIQARGTDGMSPLHFRRPHVNDNEIKGNWQIMKGHVREQWGKLTDQDVDVIAGKRDQLVGRLRERYGHAQGESERLVKEFEDGSPVY
jgi:uncharacterized protein YjbJ (UPF0337 family)